MSTATIAEPEGESQARLEFQYLDPHTLKPQDRNPWSHPPAQSQALTACINQVGWAGAALYNARTRRLIDGHLRRDEAIRRGESLPTLIGWWDEAQERLLLATINPLAMLAEQNDMLLAGLRAQIDSDMDAGLLLPDPALDALLAEVNTPAPTLNGFPDAQPEHVEARCQPGDLWRIGESLLLCGDSTNPGHVARLLDGLKVTACVTDPPYNVGEDYDAATNDEKGAEEYARFSCAWWGLVPCERRIVIPGCSNLGWWLSHLAPQAQGVWTKLNSMTRASASRFNCWEPILFYGCKNSDRPHDVFDFPTSIHFGGAGSGIADPHPCPKPVSLWREFLACYTEEGATIYEPFCGSGTGIAAAAAAGRRIAAIEHSAHYCDITLARAEALGLRSRRLAGAG